MSALCICSVRSSLRHRPCSFQSRSDHNCRSCRSRHHTDSSGKDSRSACCNYSSRSEDRSYSFLYCSRSGYSNCNCPRCFRGCFPCNQPFFSLLYNSCFHLIKLAEAVAVIRERPAFAGPASVPLYDNKCRAAILLSLKQKNLTKRTAVKVLLHI